MALWFRPGYHLTEAEVRYAMANTCSNSDAARFLHIGPACWRKYASMYFDPATGKTLYQLHKNVSGKGRAKYHRATRVTSKEILEGLHPTFPASKIKERLLEDGVFQEMCAMCGYHEQRLSDYTVPLVLIFKDGNRNHHSRENLDLICWNCYYLHYGDVREKRYIDLQGSQEYGSINLQNEK